MSKKNKQKQRSKAGADSLNNEIDKPQTSQKEKRPIN